MMKKISILLVIVGILVIVYCLTYFHPLINAVDSDTMTANSHGIKTSEWPLFIGILTAFVGICFYFIGASDEKKAKR